MSKIFNPILPTGFEAVATDAITTTSATDVAMSGMSITPGAGTYIALFSCTMTSNTNNADITCTIYANGVAQTDSVRVVTPQFQGGVTPSLNVRAQMQTQAMVTVADGQSIQIQWRRSAGTAATSARNLILMRVVI